MTTFSDDTLRAIQDHVQQTAMCDCPCACQSPGQRDDDGTPGRCDRCRMNIHAWRVCFECKHVYGSPEELQREWVKNTPSDLPGRDTPPPVEHIYFCPLCLHDW